MRQTDWKSEIHFPVALQNWKWYCCTKQLCNWYSAMLGLAILSFVFSLCMISDVQGSRYSTDASRCVQMVLSVCITLQVSWSISFQLCHTDWWDPCLLPLFTSFAVGAAAFVSARLVSVDTCSFAAFVCLVFRSPHDSLWFVRCPSYGGAPLWNSKTQ